MFVMQMGPVIPIAGDCQNKYEGIAFDGCYFYLTLPACCEIHKFDRQFCRIEIISVCRDYDSICYDACLRCFWALCRKAPNKVYKLDICLREIDCITVKLPCSCCSVLTGICCRDACNLLVAFSDGIASLSKNGSQAPILIWQAETGDNITSIETTGQNYLYSSSKNCNQGLSLCSQCWDTLVCCCLPVEYAMEDMTSVVCDCRIELTHTLYLLATKHCAYSYVIKCLVIPSCEAIGHCCPCPVFPPCPPPKPPSCSESAGSIVQSIALIETALSHILNAEGEKIQKFLCCSQNPCQIMEVNEAVNKTITAITHLEQVLYDKLQLAKDLCKCPDDCDCHNSDCP